MANALVIADDYTGAMDTGYGFAAGGRSVRVLLRGPETGELERQATAAVDVLTIDANTRSVAPETAGATVSGLLADECPVVYKKIDSTLRGNVVAEVDAAIDAIGADLAVAVPAFPSTGRVTANGRHLVDGVPLAEAGYGSSTTDLAAYFDDSRYRVTSLGIEAVVEGAESVESALETRRGTEPAVVTCDAVHDRHLEAIAAGAESLEATVLFVGSGGLASAVSVPGEAGPRRSPEPRGGGALAVVGSVNDRTLEQLAAVSDDLVHRIDPAEAVRDPERAGRRAATTLADQIVTDGRAVVTGATDATDVERADEAAAELGDDVDTGDRIATALAVAAAETGERTTLAGLFLTGGSVARAVLDSLSATAIDLTGGAVGDGIPEGYVVDGSAAGARVVTKAGGFGSPRSIVNYLNFIETDDARD
ncbi:four-carbon acid sugar kinase family protein [Natronococcus wangiae]|uniref:four-carbon acid sugar kinase family protein n=1 Tax=Natronococcus wangiae TaxID=3068275 RepID=UPI00273D00D5|nr:four-carbon acid sugar kinase family protein [Natronococcus sp. AD5]